MELRHSRELQQKRNQVGVIINEGDRNVLFFAIKGKGVLMYRKVKKIVIVPLLIITMLCCMLYTDYRKPVQAEAAVMTGDPFIDAFSWCLELIGFNASKENQEKAAHSFFNTVRENIHIFSEYTNSKFDEHLIKKSDSWKKEMSKKWENMSVKQRYMECANTYTEAEYRQSGATQDYMTWVYENYCKCETNPFADVDVPVVCFNEIIARLIDNNIIQSKYTSEQWRASGTFAILTMAVRDWLSEVSKSIYSTAEGLWNNTLGSLINTASLQNMAWYKFLNSDECTKVIDFFELGSESDTAKSQLKNIVSTLLSNIKGEEYSIYERIGTKYLLKIMPIYLRGSFYEMALMLTDIPDNTDSIKLIKGRSDYYYQFYDNSGNIIDDIAECQLIYGRKDGYFTRNVKFSNISALSSYNIFSINTVNFYFAGGSTYNYGNIIIPFGMDNVDYTSDSLIYTPDSVYTGAYAGTDDDDQPFEIIATGRGDTLANKVAGTVTDLDDVEYVPIDEVFDPDLTEEKVAAKEDVNDKAITDSLKRAEEREKEEAKAEEGTDAKPGTDTKTDTDTKEDEDLDKYKIKVIDIFPFCIPFDIYRFFSCLSADPVAPKFTIPVITENSFGIPEYSIEIDFAMFDTVAAILRKMELLCFCVGLAFATNKLIKH